MPNKTHQDIEQDRELWLLYRCYRSRFGKQCMQTLYVWNSAFDPNCKLCQQPSFVRLSLGITAMPYSSLNSSSMFFIHMILYSRKLGCEHAIATCPMALGESLRICHDLRGLLALGKGDLWSWLSPWVLQIHMPFMLASVLHCTYSTSMSTWLHVLTLNESRQGKMQRHVPQCFGSLKMSADLATVLHKPP